MPLYECDLCKFSTHLKSNYSNHLSSKKHLLISQLKLNDNKKQPTDNKKATKVAEKVSEVATFVATEFTCRYCDKRFAFCQSMNRHIKYSCTKNKDDLREVIRLLNDQMEQQMEQQKKLLENQRQEFTKILDAQSEQIEKLVRNIEIHDSFNTVNQIQHFHVKVLREKDSPFSDSELKSFFVKYSE